MQHIPGVYKVTDEKHKWTQLQIWYFALSSTQVLLCLKPERKKSLCLPQLLHGMDSTSQRETDLKALTPSTPGNLCAAACAASVKQQN